MKNNIMVVKMDKFMTNKRCPECDSDCFVVKKKSTDDYMIWYCAKCERVLLKEVVEDQRSGFISRLLARR